MADRHIVLIAFLATLVLMAFLVVFKGCSGAEPVMLALSSIATGLGGVLGGISRASQSEISMKTGGNPQKIDTEVKA